MTLFPSASARSISMAFVSLIGRNWSVDGNH